MPIRNWRAALLLATVICFSQFSRAQQPESLLIGPGDTVHILVFQTPDLEQHVRVTDAGEVPLILGGNAKIAGLTPDQAGHAIEKILIDGHFMYEPKVTVTVEAYTTQKVNIFGEVKAPGAYDIGTPRTIVEVLTMAGGLSDAANRRILIERHSTHDKVPFFVSNDPNVALNTGAEVKIYPGDTIVVPKADIVYVIGDVARPGGYTMNNNKTDISVLELVARAGGTNHSAVPSHARLIRKQGDQYVEIPIPLSQMQKGKRADLAMQPNDIIYVPFSYLRNAAINATGVVASLGSAAIYQF